MTHMLQILGIACLTAAAPMAHSATRDATNATDTSPPESVGASSVAPSAGLKVVVDPETGQIVDEPTSTQLGRLSERLAIQKRRSSEELRDFDLPGGGKGVFLDGWADHALTVEVRADGTMKLGCSQGDQHGASERQEGDQR